VERVEHLSLDGVGLVEAGCDVGLVPGAQAAPDCHVVVSAQAQERSTQLIKAPLIGARRVRPRSWRGAAEGEAGPPRLALAPRAHARLKGAKTLLGTESEFWHPSRSPVQSQIE